MARTRGWMPKRPVVLAAADDSIGVIRSATLTHIRGVDA
jgi:hypothetical protein